MSCRQISGDAAFIAAMFELFTVVMGRREMVLPCLTDGRAEQLLSAMQVDTRMPLAVQKA